MILGCNHLDWMGKSQKELTSRIHLFLLDFSPCLKVVKNIFWMWVNSNILLNVFSLFLFTVITPIKVAVTIQKSIFCPSGIDLFWILTPVKVYKWQIRCLRWNFIILWSSHFNLSLWVLFTRNFQWRTFRHWTFSIAGAWYFIYQGIEHSICLSVCFGYGYFCVDNGSAIWFPFNFKNCCCLCTIAIPFPTWLAFFSCK